MTAEIHTCSYECDRPECIRAQRDELAARLTAAMSQQQGGGERECSHEAWEENGGWCTCVDCGHGWSARTAPPSAPVGVRYDAGRPEGVVCLNCGKPTTRVGQVCDACSGAIGHQPAAAGEEIMVNAAHDVYTLPLQPSGLSSGPRFVVHVPAPEQPPAAVDEALDRMRHAPNRLWMADLVGQQISVDRMRDILSFALAAQHQEPKS